MHDLEVVVHVALKLTLTQPNPQPFHLSYFDRLYTTVEYYSPLF